ncbi:MAG: hypothetical protein LBE37_14130 [Sphingobacterium sp.]|nr:hypothetical protein [Sphingobacterium sp.]
MIKPFTTQAQEISCDELKKIQITDSNRETILKKYKSAIYRCAEITREDSLLFTVIELPLIAKHGAVTNIRSNTIGDVIKELYLMKAESEYDDLSKTMAFVIDYVNKKIDVKDKQKAIQPLTMLALKGGDEILDPNQFINYIFSPACKGLTYQQGYMKFLELQKKKK